MDHAKLDAVLARADSIAALYGDATPEQIQKVRNLYDRPGTPGEKAAARAALLRMGVDPERGTGSRDPASAYSYRPAAKGPKKFEVILQYTHNGKDLKYGPEVVEASDEIDAEMKVRKMAQETWRSVVRGGARPPEFRHFATRRVN